MPTIDMNLTSAEEQHEIDAIETERKWHVLCKKLRAAGEIK